ncbi:hypothetical protein [Methanomethylophilus alvi]|uniref:hypothetical protein n=1 Tax=Methanomethylophilus alvi TaxID=1291540 RepID=UPI0037DD9461
MVAKYRIMDVTTVEGSPNYSAPRNVTLEANGHRLEHLSKCTERTTDIQTLKKTSDGKVLNECYIDLSLNKLRELDSDRYAQDQYILSRSKFLDRNLINVLMVKLRIEGDQTLCDDDYEYLNSLLSWSRNDIYVMPLLEFDDKKRTDRVEIYDDFVKRMLLEKKSWISDSINIGMSIPQIYPRRNISDLFRLYSDENPTFVAVDFNNSRMDKPSDITGTLLKHFITMKEEKFFMYGVNVKPYKRGAENTSAWDIYMVHGAFNAIGPTHSKPRAMVLPGDWNNIGRIFDSETVEYKVIDDQHRDMFIEWMSDNYEISLDKDFKRNGKSLYPYLKRYNFQSTNGVLGEFSRAIRESDEDYVRKMQDAVPDEMKSINLMENKRRGRRSDSKK